MSLWDLDKNEKRANIVAAVGSILIPLTILGATVLVNENQEKIAAQHKCVDQALQIVDIGNDVAALSPSQREERGQTLLTIAEFAAQACRRSGLDVPNVVAGVLRGEQETNPSAALAEQLGDTAAALEGPGGDAAPAIATLPEIAADPDRPLRFFIHIAEEEQRPAARALAARFEAITNVEVPGIELVERGADDSLRCLKRAGCAQAGRLAAWINGQLDGRALTVTDLSARFEDSPRVRPGTFEVWFAPGPIELAGG